MHEHTEEKITWSKFMLIWKMTLSLHANTTGQTQELVKNSAQFTHIGTVCWNIVVVVHSPMA